MIEVVDVSTEPAAAPVLAHALERLEGARFDGYSMTVDGWVVTEDGPASLVGVRVDLPAARGGRPVRRLVVSHAPNVVRPDVAARFPEVRGADRSGFRLDFSLLGLPGEAELVVFTTVGDARALLGRISVRRTLLPAPDASLEPVLMHTLGRSGSTWLTKLLGHHPRIVSYRPYEHEPQVARYWSDVVRTLTNPMSAAQSISPAPQKPPWWTGADRTAPPPELEGDAAKRWLDGAAVEKVGALAREMIEGFYAQVAAEQGKRGASHFFERGGSWRSTAIAGELFPGLREVFLVRDLRDVLVSRFAFNRSVGGTVVGRHTVETDEQYVRQYMRREADQLLDYWAARRDRSTMVRYEDLVREPVETLARLFTYIGVESDTATVEQVLGDAERSDPEKQERHKTTPNLAASIGRWRSDLDDGLREAAEESFADALAELGYS